MRFPRRPAHTGLAVAFFCWLAFQPLQGRAEPAGGSTISVPDEPRLRSRIAERAKALGERDAQHLYDMVTPYIRAHISLADYRRDSGLDEEWERQPHTTVKVALERACNCDEWTYTDGSQTFRCVLLVDTSGDTLDQPSRNERSLQMWDYVGGEWYFGLSSAGDRCPSDASAPSAPSPPVADVAAPDLARLELRLGAYYRAVLARDARGMYDAQTPSARSYKSLEEYEQDMPQLSGQTDAIRLTVMPKEVCSCRRFDRPYPRTRCNVLVHIDQEDASGHQHRETRIDLWEHADGEWYYVASGIGDHCPRRLSPSGD
jgi:hypothetical protein